MPVHGTFFHYVVRTRRCSRLAWAGLTVIALLISPCLPITRASSSCREDEHSKVAIEPKPSLATGSGERAAFDSLARMPLRFEACDNRTPVRFLARMNESTLYVSATEATLSSRATAGAGRLGCGADLGIPRNARSPQANEQLPEPRRDRAAPRPPASATVRMQLIGANRRARVVGEEKTPTRTSYFIGKDPKRWRTDVPNYARVRVEHIYHGIDIVYYGSGQQELEYDFKVAPRADFKAIRLRFIGAQSLRVDQVGDLVIETSAGVLRLRKPVAHQEINAKEVAVHYSVNRRHEVGLIVGDYDRRLPLIIDPSFNYSTYFGSDAGMEWAQGIAVDTAGNAYIVGSTASTDLPTTPGALQPAYNAFVAKLNPTATAALYISHLGGSIDESGMGIAVDVKGNAYVTGTTRSTNFPTTANSFQNQAPPHLSSRNFVAKLNATGTALIYGTYLGGSRFGNGITIAVDAQGQATVAGYTDSARFPTTPRAVQPAIGDKNDAFVARLNHDGSALIYSTYLGGDGFEFPTCLALDSTGNAFIGGRTSSSNFPTTSHAYLRDKAPNSTDSFLTEISAAGERLVYSTFLGLEDNTLVDGVAVDLTGNAYLVGFTVSTDFPTTPGAFQRARGGDYDVFVMKLNDSGSALIYLTLFGGSSLDFPNAIAVDSFGQAYVTGKTLSADLPLMRPVQPRKFGGPLFKSTDGGANWDDVPGLAFAITSLVVDPKETTTLYAQTYNEVMKSTDGGASWRLVKTGFFGTLVGDPVRSGVLYASYFGNAYKSVDAGVTWQRLGIATGALIIDPKMPDTLYAGAGPGPPVQALVATPGVMFKSTDGGTSWTTLDFGLPVDNVQCLAIDPKVTSTLYAGTASQGLLKSTDGGATWLRTGVFVSSLVVDPINTGILYALGTDRVVIRSTDGGISWNQTLQNIGGSLAIDPQTPTTLYAGGGGFELFQTTDSGATWHVALGKIPFHGIVIDPRQPSTVYVSASVTNDAFLAKLNATGTALVYSTFLGGTQEDIATSIAVDAY
jgi:photosystem II stability/assembly factor-like uncharacterized protein